MATTFDKIIRELEKKVYHPVYFLTGDEPYYIDRISDLIENSVLTDAEKEFNQTILYGKEVDVLSVVSAAKRFPMMSSYQVVIVKEAQEMRDLFRKGGAAEKHPLLSYLENPQPTTLLVFCYKYKKVDLRTKLGKELSKRSVFLKSSKVYQDKIPAWISQFVSGKKYTIGDKACSMLSDFLGNDLSKISNELDKLMININEGEEITPELIEKYIGISKDYNVFELQDAIGQKDYPKAQRIIRYFDSNPKASPMPVTISLLFMYFRRILTYHAARSVNPRMSREQLSAALGINPFFLRGVESAARNYPVASVVNVIELLQQYDMKSKGYGNVSAGQGDLMTELVFRIVNPDLVTA